MTTAQPSYTPQDALLHVAVAAEQLFRELERVRDAAPPDATVEEFAEFAISRVERLWRGIGEHQTKFGAHGDVYTTGVPVVSVVDVTADGAKWQKVNHPDPGHPINAPRTLVTGIPVGDGFTADVIASGGGVLDVVRRKSS